MKEPLHDPRKIRRKRVEAGLNLPALAAKAGVSQGHLSEIENGKANPSAACLGKLATGMDCEIADLLVGEPKDDADDEPPRAVA